MTKCKYIVYLFIFYLKCYIYKCVNFSMNYHLNKVLECYTVLYVFSFCVNLFLNNEKEK